MSAVVQLDVTHTTVARYSARVEVAYHCAHLDATRRRAPAGPRVRPRHRSAAGAVQPFARCVRQRADRVRPLCAARRLDRPGAQPGGADGAGAAGRCGGERAVDHAGVQPALRGRRIVPARGRVRLCVALRAVARPAARLRGGELHAGTAHRRGRDRADGADPSRLRLRARRHGGGHAARRGVPRAPRRVPGLRAPDARHAARARPAGALCERLPVDAAAAGPGAAARRGRVPRLGLGLVPGARMGRPRPDQCGAARRRPRDAGRGARLRRRHAAARSDPGRRQPHRRRCGERGAGDRTRRRRRRHARRRARPD